jgi:hypothetical protein
MDGLVIESDGTAIDDVNTPQSVTGDNFRFEK